ncbi:MAG: hypothetical protein RIB65_17120 [Ilumatobacter fluminis]|uniref:hypothetical protein n=1 Tax=Ilumatobacter fluminis TaxID=467091 RepID=UPI0032F06A20
MILLLASVVSLIVGAIAIWVLSRSAPRASARTWLTFDSRLWIGAVVLVVFGLVGSTMAILGLL